MAASSAGRRITANEFAPALHEQGRGVSLFFILQIVLRRRFRQYEGVQHKPRIQPEVGDEAVQGGVAVVGGSGGGKAQGAFLLLTSEIFGQPVLIFTDCLQLALDALVLLETTILWVDIAVIELLDKVCHHAFSFTFLGGTRALSV